MYYHITAFEGTRDIRGFSALMGLHSIFPGHARPAPEPKFIIWSSHLQIHLPDLPSTHSLILLTPPSNSFIVLFPSVYPSPPIYNPTLTSILNPFLFNAFTIPPASLPLSSPLPTSHPLFPLNHLPFPYFSLPSTSSLTFKPSPCLISSPSPVLTIICNTICNTSYNTIYTTSPRAAEGHPSPSSATFAHPLHVYPPLDTHPLQCYTSYVTRSLRPLRVYSFACFISI